MALAVVVVLLVVGSVIFHFNQLYGGPWYFTDIAADWGTIDLTINITFWVTGFVFVVVNLFMLGVSINIVRKMATKRYMSLKITSSRLA
jgi:hypothetical protein